MNNFLEASEVKNVIFKNKKFIVNVILICGVLLGAYKAFSIFTADEKKVDDENALSYEEKLKSYNDQKEGYQKTINILEQELASANTAVLENPVMKINPYDCDFSTVVVSFGGEKGSKVKTVYAWMQQADTNTLFGSDDEILTRYKSSIINVIQSNYEGEVEIQIYNTSHSDAKVVAKNVETVVRQNAAKAGFTVSELVVFHQHAQSAALYDTQAFFRNNVTRVSSEIKSVKETSRTLEMPTADKTITAKAKVVSIVKFIILGAVLGAVAGVVMLIYKISKGGYLLSAGQIDNLFDMQSIGEYSSENKDGTKVIAANLTALSSGAQNLMLLNRFSTSADKQFISDMSALCGKQFVQGKDVLNDADTVFALSSADGVIIGIVPGKTRFEEIQRTIMRLNKLEKKIIGYCLFE